MVWYEIINAKSDSYIADRDAEDMLRQLATALQTADGPVDAEVFYGLTSNGARRYYVSLSPEAAELADRVLTAFDARELTAPPDLRCSSGSTLKKKKGQTSDQCGSHNHSIGGLAHAKTSGLGPALPQPGLCPLSADQPWQHERHCDLSDPEREATYLPLWRL